MGYLYGHAFHICCRIPFQHCALLLHGRPRCYPFQFTSSTCSSAFLQQSWTKRWNRFHRFRLHYHQVRVLHSDASSGPNCLRFLAWQTAAILQRLDKDQLEDGDTSLRSLDLHLLLHCHQLGWSWLIRCHFWCLQHLCYCTWLELRYSNCLQAHLWQIREGTMALGRVQLLGEPLGLYLDLIRQHHLSFAHY